jgi:hypothetical protein
MAFPFWLVVGRSRGTTDDHRETHRTGAFTLVPVQAEPDERWLLDAARAGDQESFRRLVEPRRAELLAHC